MKIEETEQLTTDFDWFGVDEEGFIAHFASAGFKRVPASVSESAGDLVLVSNYFKTEAPVRGTCRVEEDLLGLRPDWKGEQNESRYLKSFAAMADRGLFSFDIDSYLKPGIAYFRVACPMSPLGLKQLPEPIRRIIARTRLAGVRLRNQSLISYEATLKM
jgi:hypothetical protein